MRTRSKPMGDTSRPSVRLGNVLTARTLILMFLCAAKGIWFIIEQPHSSLMEYHNLFQKFLRLIPLRKMKIMMADYGSKTLKPTILYSSAMSVHFRKSVPIYVLFYGNDIFYTSTNILKCKYLSYIYVPT